MRGLQRLGRAGWSVAGVIGGAALAAFAAGVLVPLLMPLLLMVVIAVTVQPLVARLRRLGLKAGPASLLGALMVPLGLAAVAALLLWVVMLQAADWRPALVAAGKKLRATLGADPVQTVLHSEVWRTALLGAGSAVSHGVIVAGEVAIGLLIGAYLLYYLLRDGPRVVAAVEPHVPGWMDFPRAAVQLRRYMVGTAVVAAMDAAVITFGAAVLGVPFLLTIAVVTFVSAFVPYLGAWVSAIFAILLALGSGGVDTAVWMVVIVLITQNVLEGILRPLVFGRALNLHPVVVLAATVVGAAVGGLCGVFLAPPLAAIARSWWVARRAHGTGTTVTATPNG
ncbi:AI-2E family transporter [Dactylosporangium sp. CS-033363]|uniref:AI-2E family transporter n=1 Tax=Dactylosporangium sp. CS-033363 TaxID=3239935 RepID=UPI003D92955F